MNKYTKHDHIINHNKQQQHTINTERLIQFKFISWVHLSVLW